MSGTAASAELADVLADEIAALPPGHRLASESELMDRFAVGRSVVRGALARLEGRYLIRRVQGSGTYTARRVEFVLTGDEAPSFHAIASGCGAELRTTVVSAGRHPLAAPFDSLLGAAPSAEAMRIHRRGTIDGFIASYSEEWFAPGAVENVDAGLGVIESVYEIMRAFGLTPVRALTTVTVDDPPAEVSRMLAHDAVRTAWLVETLTRDAASGRMLVASRTWLRIDSVRLVIRTGAEA